MENIDFMGCIWVHSYLRGQKKNSILLYFFLRKSIIELRFFLLSQRFICKWQISLPTAAKKQYCAIYVFLVCKMKYKNAFADFFHLYVFFSMQKGSVFKRVLRKIGVGLNCVM